MRKCEDIVVDQREAGCPIMESLAQIINVEEWTTEVRLQRTIVTTKGLIDRSSEGDTLISLVIIIGTYNDVWLIC